MIGGGIFLCTELLVMQSDRKSRLITARVHHPGWRRGGGLAAGGTRTAAGDTRGGGSLQLFSARHDQTDLFIWSRVERDWVHCRRSGNVSVQAVLRRSHGE